LTCGDDAVEQLVSRDTDNDSLVDNTAIYSLKELLKLTVLEIDNLYRLCGFN
jgi:hypothetical protein